MPDPHPDHVHWPPTRLDLFAIAALGVVAYASVEREWIMVGVALFAVLIAAILPKLRGPFELSGPIRFKGELIDPQVSRFRGVLDEPTQQPLGSDPPTPPPPPAPPGQTPPHEG